MLFENPSGTILQSLNDTSSWNSRLGGKKGQPEGFAVKSITGKPGVAEISLRTQYATSHNNSNLTPLITTVVIGEWELIFIE